MHHGIEFKLLIDGRPIVITDSAMLHSLLKFSGGERDLLADIDLSKSSKVSLIVRPVNLQDSDELEAHALDCEADESTPAALAALRREIRGVFADLAGEPETRCAVKYKGCYLAVAEDEDQDEAPSIERVHHWWDRPELANWQFRDSGSATYGLALVHWPCGKTEARITSLTEAVQRASGHRCPRDERPADSPAVTEWIASREAGRG